MSDWNGLGRKSVWYSSRYYRINILWENGVVRFRDFYVFDDTYEEKYLHSRCETHACEYRNLPVMDGALYSNLKLGVFAGIYLASDCGNIVWNDISYEESGNTAKITLKSEESFAVITLNEKSIEIESDIKDLILKPVYDKSRASDNKNADLTSVYDAKILGNEIRFVFDKKEYSVKFNSGSLRDEYEVASADGKIKLEL